MGLGFRWFGLERKQGAEPQFFAAVSPDGSDPAKLQRRLFCGFRRRARIQQAAGELPYLCTVLPVFRGLLPFLLGDLLGVVFLFLFFW